MDVKRDPKILRKKKIRQAIYAGLALVAIGGVTVAVMRLQPAAPLVDSPPYIETVKQGPMVREVRGSGTLTPEDIRWITATTAGRVEQIVLLAGAKVQPDTVILVLSNPDLEQTVKAAELAWQSGVAALANRRADLQVQLLQQQAAVANATSNLNSAQADYDANASLAKDGLISSLQLRQKQTTLEQAKTQLDLAKNNLVITEDSQKSQIAPQEAEVSRLKADYDLKLSQMDDLKVKAGMTGILQVVPVERGAEVAPGTQLARVANPAVLKAELRISETLTKDLAVGQIADVDTRNGHIPGRVSRIDPAANAGTRGVDVQLTGPLPAGAVPDLSVDGTIEIEKLDNVVKCGRPAVGQEDQTIGLFKVSADGREATRVQVRLGKASVTEVQILSGLKPGDRVILSDMSQYDSNDRVRIK
jgi:HlyD family secretion protein